MFLSVLRSIQPAVVFLSMYMLKPPLHINLPVQILFHTLVVVQVTKTYSPLRCHFFFTPYAPTSLSHLRQSTLYLYMESPGVGKCNIMGYWNTGNLPSQYVSPTQQILDTLICTDACTISNACGMMNTSPRFGASTRKPLVDFAGTDSILNAADYASFPDLQLLPAIAGTILLFAKILSVSC